MWLTKPFLFHRFVSMGKWNDSTEEAGTLHIRDEEEATISNGILHWETLDNQMEIYMVSMKMTRKKYRR